jgi:hypothetical protein
VFADVVYGLLAHPPRSSGRVQALPHEAQATFFEELAAAAVADPRGAARLQLGLSSRALRLRQFKVMHRTPFPRAVRSLRAAWRG